MRTLLLVIVVCTGFVSSAQCAYVVEGEITGNVCRSWILFKSCKIVDVDAVDGEGGQKFSLKERYEKVDEFNRSTERCFIRLGRASLFSWMLSWIWPNATGPVFYRKLEDGTFEKVDVEYVTFKCREEP